MTEYNKDNPRFRDEFGCVNDLLTGESYVCGESAMIGERDALDTAIALCDLLNNLYNENNQLKQQLKSINRLIDNKIDEFKNGDYGDLPCSTIHMFLDLKRELGI